jgi:hypothetical protein
MDVVGVLSYGFSVFPFGLVNIVPPARINTWPLATSDLVAFALKPSRN